MSKITLGIVAHVDAGKTTLSETILYKKNVIRKMGRVDDKDSFMDTDDIERQRGITIYSKLARIPMGDNEVIFIDTPGHVDFSAEMERCLSVLDYAFLVINGINGVQSHTRTLWKLLDRYNIPTILFVNKMDISPKSKEELMANIRETLSEECMDFAGVVTDLNVTKDGKWVMSDELLEEISMSSENLMEEFLNTGDISHKSIVQAINDRKIYPVFFGSALKGQGVDELLAFYEQALSMDLPLGNVGTSDDDFGARCFKITRDNNNVRQTWIRITGGTLKAKDMIQPFDSYPSDARKVNEIRRYNGDKYELVNEAVAGDIVALTGVDNSRPSMGFGNLPEGNESLVQPVLKYRVLVDRNDNIHEVYSELKELNDEDPALELEYIDGAGVINIRLMGKIQLEIIQAKMQERFGRNIDFGTGNIMYKETILQEITGHGHFEPLKHFADVVLEMKPLPPGSGIVVHTDCPVDVLGKNYQHQVLNYLSRRNHPGILTGSALTDMDITLVRGKSHTKHTEGGDFRKATDIAIRNGLLRVESQLLEPYYKVILELPVNNVGRAMTDLERMHGEIMTPEIKDDVCVLTGRVPVATIIDYAAEVASYTGGMGQLILEMEGYFPCHNSQEIIEQIGYDYRTDMRHPYESIYVHGGQERYAIEGELDYVGEEELVTGGSADKSQTNRPKSQKSDSDYTGYGGLEPDLEEIFTRTYGEVKFQNYNRERVITSAEQKAANVAAAREEYELNHPGAAKRRENQAARKRKKYVLVDGYNVIHAHPLWHELAEENLDAARGALIDALCNYQGFMGCELIVVFDAYNVPNTAPRDMKHNNIYMVFTKENQTADAYIERTTHEMVNADNADVTVISSDGLVQKIIMGDGARRVSARDFFAELDRLKL